MNEQLSAYKIKYGRRIYDIYNILNSFSYALVTGNTITLYALFLKANTTVVGLLTAFMYLSFFAIPLGKLMALRVYCAPFLNTQPRGITRHRAACVVVAQRIFGAQL